MPGMRPKKEGLNERNDTMIVAKADGGMSEVNDVYSEFGELHCDKEGITIDIQEKVPVLEPTVTGRPPVQRKTIYFLDSEPIDAGFDPHFMHGKLKAAYNLSASGNTKDAERERNHKRMMDLMFIMAGLFMLFLAFVLPMFGITVSMGEPEGGSAPSRPSGPAESTFPTPTPGPVSQYWQRVGRGEWL